MVVNREIGMKLKQAGYDLHADYMYKPFYAEVQRKIHSGHQRETSFNKENKGNPDYADWCDAPEKGDVFAWFRGEGIIGAIHVLSKKYSFLIFTNDRDDGFTGKDFDTWEQAEDACIEEMIKLIQ